MNPTRRTRKPSMKFRSPRKESVPVEFVSSTGEVRRFMATKRVPPKTKAEVERRTIAGQLKIGRKVTKTHPFVLAAVRRWEETR